jgi:biopolymer transport protein ExbD
MNFRRHLRRDEPEINLIPFIDVLLVILIFLMLSTTYSRFSELQLTLPSASAQPLRDAPAQVVVAIAGDGRTSIDRRAVDGRSVERLAAELGAAAAGRADAVVLIAADATTPHQAVVNVLDAARRAGLTRLVFATQGSDGQAAR